MANTVPDDEKDGRFRRQRNLFAAVAVCSLALGALAVPRKIARHRELRALNDRIVALQRSIVIDQLTIREVEKQILDVQQQIRSQPSK